MNDVGEAGMEEARQVREERTLYDVQFDRADAFAIVYGMMRMP